MGVYVCGGEDGLVVLGLWGQKSQQPAKQVLPDSKDQITLELVRDSIMILGHPSIQGKTPARGGSVCVW